jgi:hypothetical protein
MYVNGSSLRCLRSGTLSQWKGTYDDGIHDECPVAVVVVLGLNIDENLTNDVGKVLGRRCLEAKLDARRAIDIPAWWSARRKVT